MEEDHILFYLSSLNVRYEVHKKLDWDKASEVLPLQSFATMDTEMFNQPKSHVFPGRMQLLLTPCTKFATNCETI